MAVEPTALGLGACVSKAFIRLETINPILHIKIVGEIIMRKLMKDCPSEIEPRHAYAGRVVKDSSDSDIQLLKNLSYELGAGKIVVTSPEDHDKMIAYTSQLAHIVSSAYVKSPELQLECGFSGGSFQDMTRIATMNEKMWTDLFMQNRDNLIFELDTLIENLNKYRSALESHNSDEMLTLIAEGRKLKEDNLRHRVGQPN